MDWEPDPELVTLAQFAAEEEFLVVRALLESEGIECFCPDLYSRRYLEGRARGEIRLRVKQEDLADARAILEAPGEPLAEDGNA